MIEVCGRLDLIAQQLTRIADALERANVPVVAPVQVSVEAEPHVHPTLPAPREKRR